MKMVWHGLSWCLLGIAVGLWLESQEVILPKLPLPKLWKILPWRHFQMLVTILENRPALAISSGVSIDTLGGTSKLFWNWPLLTTSTIILWSKSSLSLSWVIVYNLLSDTLAPALDDWSQSTALCLESSTDSPSHLEWKKKKASILT